MNDPTSGLSPCAPAPIAGPRSDAVPVTIIILVVVLSSVYLATLGMTAVAVGSLLTAATAAAGYLVRQMRGQVTR